ncbi:hypothetical protein DPMN_077108 [Dreissena polymorpha]|uniref:Uncharacterized protein n=1 Tax=Dreissena polymorpha TaxID=45954 RepID=A0A9D4BPA9_DREPO|nr:hypothetical protein DPMN_077108 [Dreissena polymorpha]
MEMMVRSHVCSSLDTCILNNATKLPGDAQVVNLVLRSQFWWHPSCLLYPSLMENTFSDDQVTCGAKVGEYLPVVVHLA